MIYSLVERIKVSNDEFLNKIFTFAKKFLKYENYELQCNSIELIAVILKYSKTQEEVLQYIDEEILSQNFYNKRLYINFLKKCLDIFSITFIQENGILEKVLKLFEEGNIFLIIEILNLLPTLYILLPELKKNCINELVLKLKREITTKDFEYMKVISMFNYYRV
jgi:hypothetical protein